MFMGKDKKSNLAIIIAKKMGKPEESKSAPESEDGGELDQSMGYDSAGEEILKAIESKDKSMLVEAIKNIVQMCMDESPEESEESEESAEEKPV